jgi:hypothetical protein
MISIDHLILDSSDPDATAAFYGDALQVDERIQFAQSSAASTGFRGFTIGLDVSDPAQVDALVSAAVQRGATTIKATAAQPWGGYSGVIRTPDGVPLKVATSDSRQHNTGAALIERVVLLLGVEHVGRSKDFYVEAGLEIATEAGNKYVEFTPGQGAVTLALYQRPGLAKEFGVDPEGEGAHLITIASTGDSLVDLDGFTWASSGDRES